MSDIATITEKIGAVCPIDGINSDGAIFFKAGATAAQKAAAQSIMDQEVALIGQPDPWTPNPTLAKLRAAREIVLNRLMGIATAAIISSDTATAQACATARLGLLNMTADPAVIAATDEASLQLALYNAYSATVVQAVTAAPSLKQAFEAFNSFNV